ncbi:MAG: sulfatase-like hydrolase/transferase [Halioglobus sp.]|nr:sulfatase-like hydrolase/transferase [Halioglobus sp.]
MPEELPDQSDAHAFGVYGGQVWTPHIDHMAAEGIRFEHANVVSTVCTASRYSFLTGRYPTRSLGPHFLALYPPGTMSRPENMVELDPPGTLPNLPQLLQANGYRTGFVGKSHIIRHTLLRKPGKTWEGAGLRTYPRNANPYDDVVNAALAHNHQQWQQWMMPYGFDFVDGIYAGNLLELFMVANNHHHLEWTVSKALQFLEGSRGSKQPFFLYFATTLPHGPAANNVGGTRYPFGLGGPVYPHGLDGDIRVTPEGILDQDYDFMPPRSALREQNAAAGFPEQVAYMAWLDAGIGAILDKLQAIGAADNTLVVLTSDHGSWRRGKATLYEGGVRVPLITRWPAAGRAGRIHNGLISSIDVAPTVLDLAGVTPPPGTLDGRSFRAVLQGSDAPVRTAVFAELGWARMVKTRRWKYIAVRYPPNVRRRIEQGRPFLNWNNHPPNALPYYSPNSNLGYFAAKHNPHYFAADQLFDLMADPTEQHNVLDQHPEVAAKLRQRLALWLRRFPDRPFGEFTDPPETTEAASGDDTTTATRTP